MLLYLHAKVKKHIQLDLRVSLIPCRARDYCEKGIDTERKEVQQ